MYVEHKNLKRKVCDSDCPYEDEPVVQLIEWLMPVKYTIPHSGLVEILLSMKIPWRLCLWACYHWNIPYTTTKSTWMGTSHWMVQVLFLRHTLWRQTHWIQPCILCYCFWNKSYIGHTAAFIYTVYHITSRPRKWRLVMWWVSPRATSFVTSFWPTTSFVTCPAHADLVGAWLSGEHWTIWVLSKNFNLLSRGTSFFHGRKIGIVWEKLLHTF